MTVLARLGLHDSPEFAVVGLYTIEHLDQREEQRGVEEGALTGCVRGCKVLQSVL